MDYVTVKISLPVDEDILKAGDDFNKNFIRKQPFEIQEMTNSSQYNVSLQRRRMRPVSA